MKREPRVLNLTEEAKEFLAWANRVINNPRFKLTYVDVDLGESMVYKSMDFVFNSEGPIKTNLKGGGEDEFCISFHELELDQEYTYDCFLMGMPDGPGIDRYDGQWKWYNKWNNMDEGKNFKEFIRSINLLEIAKKAVEVKFFSDVNYNYSRLNYHFPDDDDKVAALCK